VPRWSDDVAFVAELAQKLIGLENPLEVERRQRRQAGEELERALRLLHRWRRRPFARRLARLRTYLWLREQMRDASLRLYAAIRRFALEVGRRAAAAGHLASADDAFYLTVGELLTTLETRLDAVAARRRADERMYRHFKPPAELGRAAPVPAATAPGNRLIGIGASPGVFTGQVCVLHSLDDVGRLGRGDVLVCPFTDPGWTPVLSVAGAVVAEAGGLLSHAAVLCRELGRPAVLSVANATGRLPNGQRVRVDGDHGHVDLLE
jgi:pyruvate,water dikinase